MKLLLTTLIAFTLALPAVAQEDTQVVEVSHKTVETHAGPVVAHKVESRTGNTTDIRTSINGHYLWITFGDPEDTYAADLSVDISDVTITQAIVSLDGTVTLVRTAPEPVTETPEDKQPGPEVIEEITTLEFEVTTAKSLATLFGIRAD